MHPDGMNWSWPALEATPVYVRRFCWDLLQIKRKAEADRVEAAQKRKKPGGPGGH